MFPGGTLRALGLVACLSLLLAAAFRVFAGGAPDASPQEKEIQALLLERRAALREAARYAKQAFEANKIPLSAVIECQRELSQADLELAKTPQERVAVFKRLVEQTAALERVTEDQCGAGQATQFDLLRSKSARLQAQIDLARAEQKTDETSAK